MQQLQAMGAPAKAVGDLVAQAAGNFLYIKFLLDEVSKGRPLAELVNLPKGLYPLYRSYLDRLMPEMLAIGASATWDTRFRPLLGDLSVAIPAAPSKALPGWLNVPSGTVSALLNSVIQIVELAPDWGTSYRLYHRSMNEFLGAATYEENNGFTLNRYHAPPQDHHDLIVKYYCDNFDGNWQQCDAYGLQQLVTHIHAGLVLETLPRRRKERKDRLYTVVFDDSFRRSQCAVLRSIRPTLDDLRLALRVALADNEFSTALASAATYRDTMRIESVTSGVFEALDAGQLRIALQRSDIFGVSPHWASALKHYLAWEAARRGNEFEARLALDDTPWMAPKTSPLCDALLVETARILARKQDDAEAVLGRLSSRADDPTWLLQAYPQGMANPPAKETLIQTLEQQLEYQDQQIAGGDMEWVSQRNFATPDNALYSSGEMRRLLVGLAGEKAGQEGIDRALRPTLVNPYVRYRDIALVVLGVAAAAVPDREWASDRLRTILRTGLDEEGATFTFDLASVLYAEGTQRNLASNILLPLSDYLGHALNSSDRWGTSIRAHSAHAGALFWQGWNDEAVSELRACENLQNGFAGYAVMTFLSLANRWLQFGDAARATNLAAEAMNYARRVLDAVFREERVRLVDNYLSWLKESLPVWDSVPTRIAAMPDPELRLAYIEQLSARWAAPNTQDAKALGELIPLVLSDGTTLDAVLGRYFGLVAGKLDEGSLLAAVRTCAAQLMTGRPWELGQ
jgi:hypothetical protein